jgi:5-hydroxyisourate hydrolase-like protein (transthyretin family)
MYRQTDKDGRCTSLLDPTMKLSTGVYKLNFHTGEYFTKQGVKTLYPFVEVCHPISIVEYDEGKWADDRLHSITRIRHSIIIFHY